MSHSRDWDAPVLTAILVWLCALPLIGLFVLPVFRVQIAVTVAAVLLVLALLVCWVLCRWPAATTDRTDQR